MLSARQEQEPTNVSGRSRRQVSRRLIAAIEQLQNDPNRNSLSEYLLQQIMRGFHEHRPGTDALCYTEARYLLLPLLDLPLSHQRQGPGQS
jgi:hypothetical protein